MEIIKKENNVTIKSKAPIELYMFFKLVTPQFYANKTKEQIKQEIASIELLTRYLPFKTLQKACEVAVKYYPIERAENPNLYFDINYILSCYKIADYMVRNEIEKEEDFFTDINDIRF